MCVCNGKADAIENYNMYYFDKSIYSLISDVVNRVMRGETVAIDLPEIIHWHSLAHFWAQGVWGHTLLIDREGLFQVFHKHLSYYGPTVCVCVCLAF